MKAFQNIAGKGENAGNHHFLLFPQYFLPVSNSVLQSHLFYSADFVRDSHYDRIHFHLLFDYCLESGYVGKQPAASKEYNAEHS